MAGIVERYKSDDPDAIRTINQPEFSVLRLNLTDELDVARYREIMMHPERYSVHREQWIGEILIIAYWEARTVLVEATDAGRVAR